MAEREPGASTLPDTLGTVPQLLRGYGEQTSAEGRGSYARKQLPALLTGSAEAQAEQKFGEFERDQAKLQKEAEAEREVARGTRIEAEKLDTGLQERGVFEAPQYKASDYAANAATRLLTAVLLGGVARTSAAGQLQAIKAMQDAEQQGLTDQFESARLKFDEQEKARQDSNKMLKERFDRMMDLLSKDRNAALVEAKLIEGNLGRGIIAAELRAGNYAKAYELFSKATDQADKLALERVKAQIKRTNAPDRTLKPGERWNAEKGVIEAIPGSDLFKKQKEKFAGEYKDAQTVIDQTNNGLRKIREILDPANTNGFNKNFGGYDAYATQYISGDASDMRTKINSFKSDMKAAGKQLLAQGGSIGQITEREWPILEQMIASIDPVLSEEEARKTFEDIEARFKRLIGRTINGYETQFADSQYYVPLQVEGAGEEGQGGGQGGGQSVPQPGDVQDGYRFKGGDPADANNWEKV